MNNADSFQDLIRNSSVVHESATKFEKKVIDCILPSYDTKFYEYQNNTLKDALVTNIDY